MKRIPQHFAREDGTAMIEMALVLPIIAFLLLGIVDFGRAINYWNDSNQIAADAARFAAVGKNPAPSGTTFREWIRLQADTPELRDGDQRALPVGQKSTLSPLQVKVCAPNGTAVGNPLIVRVGTRFNLIPFLNRNPGSIGEKRSVFGTMQLAGKATMRLEKAYDASVLGALDPVADCA